MNSVLLWIGGLLIAALGLLFAVPSVIDWNSYRGVFEEEASRVLGRDVRVGGKVNLRLLPVPYVRFEKVRISDTDATLGEPFFRAEAFTLWLSPMPLLRGAIEANEIELDRPVLRLAIDANGTGNWQSLKPSAGKLPIVLSDVVLQQIRIRNGIVSLKSHDRPEPAELSAINGDVSATAVSGPYRFIGNIAWNGINRELRLATAPQEDNGKLRFRANIRVPETGNSYTFDGGLSELTTRAKLEGSLTAKLPISGPPTAAAAPAKSRASSDQNAFDLKAAVNGNFDSVKLSDINIAFEQDGKPQLVTGEASGSWSGGQRMEARLTSRWLDLDRITGDGATRPIEAAREIIERIGALLPADGTTFATLDVDQVNLGGEALSGLRLALARAAGRTSIGELKAGLPGNARASIRGVLGANGDTKTFEGEIVLRGSSYQRFAAWAGKAAEGQRAGTPAGQPEAPAAAATGKGDGPFSLASPMKMVPGRLELSDASVEFSGTQLRGDLDWRWIGQKELRLTIDGGTVDVSALAPGLLDFDSWRGIRPTTPGAQPTASSASPLAALGAKARLVNAAVGNLRVAVRAQTLTDGVNKLGDVDANLSFEPDALIIPGLKFVSPQGVSVDVQGEIKALEAKPNGRLRGWLTAKSGASIQSLASVLAGGDAPLRTNWGTRASNLDLGFSIVLGATPGNANADQMSLRTNGTLDDGRLDLALTLAGGLNAWREAPIDLSLKLDSPEMPNMIRRIVAGRDPAPGVVGTESAQGALLLKLVGTSASALTSFAQLDANGIGLSYNGRAKLGTDDTVDLGGELTVAAADAGDLFTLMGSTQRPHLGGIGVEGTLTVTRDGGKTKLESRAFNVGTSRISGQLGLATKGDRLAVEGQLAVNQASFPVALGMVLDGREGTAANRVGRSAPWPDTTFGLGVFDTAEGRIGLTTPDLQFADGLSINDAAMTVEFQPGRVGLANLTGKVLGGQLTGRTTIERAPGGATVTIDAQVNGARLSSLQGRTAPPAAAAGKAPAPAPTPANLGEANITLKLEGRGPNPRAVVTVLSGKGELELKNARVLGIAPNAIDKTAQLLIEGQTEINRTMLEQTIRSAFAASEINVASRKLPIEAIDGAIKIGALVIETPDASIRNQTVADLNELKFDSEWRVSPKRSSPVEAGRPSIVPRPPLPPVTLVWTGPLGSLTAVDPRFSVDQLEREISVRKMERDVERLEEMRRQDEARARLEQDRMRRIDQDAASPGAGAGSGGGAAPPVIPAPFVIQSPPAPAQRP